MSTTAQRIVTILVYADIAAAHDFLVDTFGFESGGVHRNEEDEVMHGEVSLAGEVIWLHRVSPDYGLRGVADLGAATGMLNIFVDDVDAHHARTVAAGARIVFPPPISPTANASTAYQIPKTASGPSPPEPDPARPAGRSRYGALTSPAHDQLGMSKPSGTSSADR